MKIHALRALRHPNFRLYFFGQSISLAGTWMTRLASSWLVYRLTGSTLLLGLVSFAGQIPTFLLGPFAGVWVDRLEKRKVILATQFLAALLMKRDPEPVRKAAASMLVQLQEGWVYVSAAGPIRTVMIMFAIFSFMGVPYAVLMPVFATKILHGGPHTLGWLMGASGIGAGLAALTMAARKSVRGLDATIAMSAGLMGAGLIAFSFSRSLWISLALMAITGFGMMLCYTASSTVIQTIVDEDKRGRVMSYWTMAYMGASPFGSLLAGGLSPVLGAPGTIVVCGLGCVTGGIWFWFQLAKLRPALRPIYEQLGVLPAKG